MKLAGNDLNTIRQWFDAVQDLNPAYLTITDYRLARSIYQELDMRVPRIIADRVVADMETQK